MDKITVCTIMKMIDHSLLHPALTDRELDEECQIALKYDVAAVCVKPYHTKRAVELLKNTGVEVSAVIGFPHGNSTTEIKVLETKQVVEDGATEVDMVVNIGKVLGCDWDYVRAEIDAIHSATRNAGAILKVIFENDFLPQDSFKIRLCEICNAVGAEYVKTSTGYNYNKESDGRFSYKGATEHDLRLMREYAAPEIRVKAAGFVGTLDAMIKVRDWGVARVGTKNTIQIYNDATVRFRE